ncbi:MAG: RNA polymerase sigma factor [Candidatus Symbiothrix sp.]|jgi:RNA polymerase sigma-70 factor (ECF subfamily)|nr:RNA polymerase sigma factor [Candidatus Symbiothrix sp.]
MDNSVDLQALIERCKSQDRAARKQLYELFAPAMQGVCFRYAGEKETARDLLHEGFIKVFTKIDTYLGAGSFEGWMRKIFVTTSLEFLRSKQRFFFSIDNEEYKEIAYEENENVVEKLSAEEILQCVNELPTGFRTVFNMYAVEGYSHAEIANMLNIKEASSRSQFARARMLLQEKIRKLYGYERKNE